MNPRTNKKTQSAAWAFFLTLTALICSNARAQSSLESVDFIEGDTTLSEQNEVIHYVFVMDNDLGALGTKTPDLQKKKFVEFQEIVKSHNPGALVSVLESTYELGRLDFALKITSDLEKESIESILNELALSTPSLSPSEFHNKLDHASRTIILIWAHGGGYPYEAGEFLVEQSHLAQRTDVEFVLLTCMAGNLDMSETPNIKVFGIGGEHVISNSLHITMLLEYLITNAAPIPTSALEFYEAYKTYYNQTPTLIAVLLYFMELLRPTQAIKDLTQNTYNTLASYYIDSVPAQAFELLTAWIPYFSNPWYADPEEQDFRGSKENVWWLLTDSEDYYISPNDALLLVNHAISTLVQWKILRWVLTQMPIEEETGITLIISSVL